MDLVFKRKIRWYFCAINEAEEAVFPPDFIKLHERPAFPYAAIADENGGGKVIPIPGEIRFEQVSVLSTDYDKLDFNKLDNLAAQLETLDAVGNVLERWKYKGKLVLDDINPSPFEETELQLSWRFVYTDAEYEDFVSCTRAQ